MTRKTRISLALASAISLTLMAACTPSGGGDAAGDAEGTELVWAIGGADSKPGGVNQKIADKWNELNPDKPVRIEVLPDSADQQREQQALELQAEGSGFDIIGLDVIWTGEYAENGWLEDLSDLQGDLEGQILAGPMESAQWGGQLWAVPFNSNASVLYYRTDLVDTPPTTWDEMCTVGAEVGKANDIGGYIAQGAQYEGFVVNWLMQYFGNGGELYNEDQSASAFDEEKAQAATKWFSDGLSNGCFAAGFNTSMEEEARNTFQQGDAVFMVNWPYAHSLMDVDESPVKGKFAIANLPAVAGGESTAVLGGFNNGVSAFSENKDAAKEFIIWLGTDPVAQKMLVTEGSVPPVAAATYEDAELKDDPVMSLMGTTLGDAKPRPPAPQWNEISVTMQQQLYPAYNGEKDPAAAAAEIAKFLNSSIGS